jgi:hypothetical protein
MRTEPRPPYSNQESDMTKNEEAYELFKEARKEDRREGGRFDAIGFGQFFPEHDPHVVADAWLYYRDFWFNRGMVLEK